MMNSIMDFIEEESENFQVNDCGILPSFHSCEAYVGMKIIKAGKLQPRQCDVMNKKVTYFFYGKPSYIVAEKFPNKKELSYLPVCFIVDTTKIPIYKAYPFDTGGFAAGLYSGIFHRDVDLNSYEIDNNILSIRKYVSVMFENNINYINGNVVSREARNMDIYSLSKLITSEGDIRFDERANTIELSTEKETELSTSLKCIIMPKNLLRDKEIKKFLSDNEKIDCITYNYRNLTKAEIYHETVFRLAMKYMGVEV